MSPKSLERCISDYGRRWLEGIGWNHSNDNRSEFTQGGHDRPMDELVIFLGHEENIVATGNSTRGRTVARAPAANDNDGDDDDDDDATNSSNSSAFRKAVGCARLERNQSSNSYLLRSSRMSGDDFHSMSSHSAIWSASSSLHSTAECVICRISLAEIHSVCNDCYEEFSPDREQRGSIQSYPNAPIEKQRMDAASANYRMWKAWIRIEQAYYQKKAGCTRWNMDWENSASPKKGRVNLFVHPIHSLACPELLSLKRVKACIGWAVHGILFEFIDGTRVGYVNDVPSIHDNDAISKRRSTEWFDIAYGDHITAIYGYNLSRSCFLCHSLNLQFASGRTIKFQSKHEPWKDSKFHYNVPDSALVHHISFQDGRCIGFSAAENYHHLSIHSPARVRQLDVPQQNKFELVQLVAQRIDQQRLLQGELPLGKDVWNIILFGYLSCADLDPQPTESIIAKVLEREM